jgi:hypothetical protein
MAKLIVEKIDRPPWLRCSLRCQTGASVVTRDLPLALLMRCVRRVIEDMPAGEKFRSFVEAPTVREVAQRDSDRMELDLPEDPPA